MYKQNIEAPTLQSTLALIVDCSLAGREFIVHRTINGHVTLASYKEGLYSPWHIFSSSLPSRDHFPRLQQNDNDIIITARAAMNFVIDNWDDKEIQCIAWEHYKLRQELG